MYIRERSRREGFSHHVYDNCTASLQALLFIESRLIHNHEGYYTAVYKGTRSVPPFLRIGENVEFVLGFVFGLADGSRVMLYSSLPIYQASSRLSISMCFLRHSEGQECLYNANYY